MPHLIRAARTVPCSDLGFSDTSLVGAPARSGDGRAKDYVTPHIDRLAREGILLDSYYVNRLCSPTRTSLLSSRFASNIVGVHSSD